MSAKIVISTENLPYEDWLEYRKQGIGGLRRRCGLAASAGTNPRWSCGWKRQASFQIRRPGKPAYWGTQLEPLVRAEFTRRTGIEVTHTKQLLQSAEHPFMLANLDGTCEHPDFGPCIFEAKTASAYKAKEWDNSIPEEYLLQIQHYMAVTGYRGAYIAALIGGNTFRWKFVERDEGLIAVMIHLEAEFWGYVQEGTPPPLDGSEASARLLSEQFPSSVPQSQITLPDTATDLLRQYDTACEQLEVLEGKKREAENLLKQMLGANETGTAQGEGHYLEERDTGAAGQQDPESRASCPLSEVCQSNIIPPLLCSGGRITRRSDHGYHKAESPAGGQGKGAGEAGRGGSRTGTGSGTDRFRLHRPYYRYTPYHPGKPEKPAPFPGSL